MVNYDFINKSILYYEDKGFKRVESPWTITESISNITKPIFANNFSIKEKNKVLVASGEQSFLYLYLKGFLPKGQFQTVTPCFRDEDFDIWHTKYFIKNELIKTDSTTLKDLDFVLITAKKFFESICNEAIEIKKLTSESYDLFYKDIEIGSYGIRSCPYLTWIYGTGIAEPRFSSVLQGNIHE